MSARRGGARPDQVPVLDPALFAGAVLAGIAAGESGAGESGAGEPLSVDRMEADGSVSVTQLPDSPHSRAAFALKRHFGDDDATFRSAWARFQALMDLFSRGTLEDWARPGEGSRSALHPAVIDVASHMRLSANGRFAPRKFLDTVAATARERYPHLTDWKA